MSKRTVIATGFQHCSNLGSTLQPDHTYDFRPKKQPDLEIPAIQRKAEEAVALVEDSNYRGGSGNGNGKRIHLGEIDLNSEPPDLSLPAFLRRNKG